MKTNWVPNWVPEIQQTEPQEQVEQQYKDYLEKRIIRLEMVLLAAQNYCGHGDAQTAYAVISQALTGL